MSASTITKKTYYTVFAALMVLLFLTVFVAYVHLDPTLAILIAMAIAVTKAVLVILYFMHVKENSRLTWLVVSSGFVWLIFLIGITLTDYYSRDWPGPGYGADVDVYSSPYDLNTGTTDEAFPIREYESGSGHGEDHE